MDIIYAKKENVYNKETYFFYSIHIRAKLGERT